METTQTIKQFSNTREGIATSDGVLIKLSSPVKCRELYKKLSQPQHK